MMKHFRLWFFASALLGIVSLPVNSFYAQQNKNISDSSWSVRIAKSFMERTPKYIVYGENPAAQKWNYEQGLMLNAIRQMYLLTGDKKYADYIKNNLDGNIKDDGSISTYKLEDFNLDQIGPGRAVLFTYEMTKEEKYKKAAGLLFRQLSGHPRTQAGGFWHKLVYPFQMWLDGLYMAEPFYAEYSVVFNQPKNFDDITHQFEIVYEKTLDHKTGLLRHAWDESKQQQWADKKTGQSQHVWGRAMGWYLMAIVDVLDYLPHNHPKRQMMIGQLKKLSEVLMKYRDEKSKVWYQIIDMKDKAPNYPEASASAMFVYAFAKGANKGYLDREYLEYAKESWEGMLKQFVVVDASGMINLNGTCQGAGLGGKPYRDGTFEYYMSEKQRTNDFKGYGPFLLSAIELERAGLIK